MAVGEAPVGEATCVSDGNNCAVGDEVSTAAVAAADTAAVLVAGAWLDVATGADVPLQAINKGIKNNHADRVAWRKLYLTA